MSVPLHDNRVEKFAECSGKSFQAIVKRRRYDELRRLEIRRVDGESAE